MNNKRFNTEQVAKIIGVSTATLKAWRAKNEGPPSFKLGRKVVYDERDIESWIAEQKQATIRGD